MDIKKTVIIINIYIIFSIILLPCIITSIMNIDNPKKSIINDSEESQTKEALDIEQDIPRDMQTESEKEEPIASGLEEYIKGVVSAEVPALFHEEALKAQAIAARTYALRMIENSDKSLIYSDIGQAYESKDELKKKWGSNYDVYYKRISDAVDATKGEIMVYENQPILAVFHSTSAGKTENAENIWKNELPYLKSTDSGGDVTAPNFQAETTIEKQKIIESFKKIYPDFSCDTKGLFKSMSILENTEAGYVKTMQVGNKTLSGRQVREALGLRSCAFSIKNADNAITFTTKGYGHGAGMSQYGANAMAESGSTYNEILKHYYFGIEIQNYKNQ